MSEVGRFAIVAVVAAVSAARAGELNDLATVVDRQTHRASSRDASGGNDDFVAGIEPKSVTTLLDVDGPGRITHLWFTAGRFPGHETFLRDLVLRIYWEGSEVPSVDVPLGDFFAMGHARWYRVNSLPVAVGVNPTAMNCYWPMPFHKHARIQLVNNGVRTVRKVYYNIDYETGAIPSGQALFHAQFRRALLRSQANVGNTTGADNYVILDTQGRGQYVGCVLFVDSEPGGWWGEGDDMIFIDGAERPTIVGTGSEDYFCNAWGYQEAFSHPYYGAPLIEKTGDGGGLATVYRWHVADPVRFQKQIRVTIERIFDPGVVNEYSSVAYWYQVEPVRSREPLAIGEANHSRRRIPLEVNGTELEASLNARGVKTRVVATGLDEGFEKGGWLRIELTGDEVEVPVPVPCDGVYRVAIKPVNAVIDGRFTAGVKGGERKIVERRKDRQDAIPYADLGEARAKGGVVTLILGGNKVIGLDSIRVRRVGD